MKHKFKIIALSSTIALSSLVANQANAVEGLSANVAATSNYLWRGVTQTNNASAISGGIDYANDSGLYAGVWTSNVDYSDAASYELDLYFGFTGKLDNGVGYDVGYIYYGYPDSNKVDAANQYDFAEIYGNVSISYFTFGANYGIQNDDGAAWADKALYLTADSEFEVAEGLSLAVHIGNYNFDDATPDYTDYGVSLSKSGFTIGLSNTDLDGDDAKVYVSYSVDIDL